jgi:hypothetical protein
MAHVQCTDVQDRPTAFLDLTSLTLDEFRQLVPPFDLYSAYCHKGLCSHIRQNLPPG